MHKLDTTDIPTSWLTKLDTNGKQLNLISTAGKKNNCGTQLKKNKR
jgi:hypothetical protein